MRRNPRPWPVWPLLFALVAAASRPAQADSTAPTIEPTTRDAEVPLSVPLSVHADGDPQSGSEDMSEGTEESPPAPSLADAVQATPRVPSPTAPITPVRDAEQGRVAVAVGLGASAPGSKPEKAIVDALERSARGSIAPTTQVRRLRAGAGEGKAICRERRDDLVILLEYLPDRDDAVLVTRDCRLDRELAIRATTAAREPGFIAVLWDEHRGLVRAGAKERKVRLSRKVKTGLIAGGAILAVGLAIGLVLANSLRRDTVVITVGP